MLPLCARECAPACSGDGQCGGAPDGCGGTCDGQVSVWLLRPSTGGLYRFDELADAGPVSTAPLRYAPGATGLSVHRVLDCDHVHLELPGDTHVEVAG